jgi:hypothetical protein
MRDLVTICQALTSSSFSSVILQKFFMLSRVRIP